jgi:hypothetical protein
MAIISANGDVTQQSFGCCVSLIRTQRSIFNTVLQACKSREELRQRGTWLDGFGAPVAVTEEYCPLGVDSVQSGRSSPMYRSHLLPSSSMSK